MKELNCRKKLRSADYHYDQFNESCDRLSMLEASYNLSAFITEIASIPDHALQDINEQFDMNIPFMEINKGKSKPVFIRNAFKQRIEDQSNILLWRYWDVWLFFRKLHESDSLISERHLNIHRRTTSLVEHIVRSSSEESEKDDSDFMIMIGEYALEGDDEENIEPQMERLFNITESLVRYTEEFVGRLKDNGTAALNIKPVFTSNIHVQLFEEFMKTTK